MSGNDHRVRSLSASAKPLRALIACLLAGALALGCGGPAKPPKPPPKQKHKPKPRPIPKMEEDQPPEACAKRDKELAAAYTPYLDAFSNVGLELSPDGKLLLFLSNRGGGSYQLYTSEVRKTAAPPTVIAEAKDGVAGARFTPDGKYILFLRDKDKDENWQIFRATTDGKEVKALTEEPKRYHYMPLVTADSKHLVYFRGSHKSPGITLMRQPVAGGKAEAVYETKGFYQLTDLSPDGERALVFKLPSLSRSVLKVVDLKTGKARRLAPPRDKKAHAHTGRFSPDGKSVYVITDEDAEVAGLNRIDARTGKVLTTFNDYVAEVADVQVSPNSPFVAVLLNEGSHHLVKLLDAESLEEKISAKLPKGALGLGRFTPDGKGLVVTVSTASQPTDVVLVDTRRGAARPLRRDKRPGLRKLARVKTTVERLATFDKMKVPINVYLPARLPRGKKLPVIVSIHGGPAASATIRWNPTLSFWISRGFAVVEPNVRGSTGFGKKYEKADNKRKRMDALKDLAAVNKWIRLQPWADTGRLAVYGGSYGGYMTYMALGHQPEQWNAGVGAVGVVNLLTFLKTTSGRIRPLITAEFGSLKKDRKFLKKISPIKVVKKIQAPVFIYQGLNDPRVPRAEQDQLVRALRKRGVMVEYMIAEDEGHSISQRHNKLEFVSRSMRFLEEHLNLPGPSEECKTASRTPPEPEKATKDHGKKKKARKKKAKKKKAKKNEAKKNEAKKNEAKADQSRAGADKGARPAKKSR